MAVNTIKKVEGKIIISEKNFNRMVQKDVMKNNQTSGKVLLPKDMINKKVYVVWFEEENKK